MGDEEADMEPSVWVSSRAPTPNLSALAPPFSRTGPSSSSPYVWQAKPVPSERPPSRTTRRLAATPPVPETPCLSRFISSPSASSQSRHFQSGGPQAAIANEINKAEKETMSEVKTAVEKRKNLSVLEPVRSVFEPVQSTLPSIHPRSKERCQA
ncbi:Hypothetical predicted protein [Podarcis lilfordi]|uniref:Uncharacterized protein n=1 Tax=Podarcis lilfordi TaxID=74358 RepID=A0AA35JXH9_9SAUR|nr:Hypothetical predicted protein [Podarcis lilfordi]